MLPEELELWELLELFPMLPEMLPETPPGEEGGGGLPFRQPNAGELPRQRLKQETREAAIRAGIECVAAIQGVIERSGQK